MKEDISIIENLTYVGRVETNIGYEKFQISADCEK